MPTIDTVKRITTEEFKSEDREIAERIGNIYNYFAEQVTNVLNGNVDLENLTKERITIELSVGTNGVPLQTTKFSSKTGLVGTNVINTVNTTNRVNFLDSKPNISFTSQGTGIYSIDHVTGLNPGENYTLTIDLLF
jgi:hypothetical protein